MCKFLVVTSYTRNWGTDTDDPAEFDTLNEAVDYIKQETSDEESDADLEITRKVYQEIPITVEKVTTVTVTIL